jgi:Tol biopolymer transport system component
MSASERFERDFGGVLVDFAEPRYPDYFDDVLDVALRNSQRPAWTFLERWLPMSAIALPQRSGMPRLWRTMGALALILLLLAAVLFAVGSQRRLPAPFGLAANGSIASAVGGDIFVRSTEGGTDRLIVGGPEVDGLPSFSRDGTRLMFVRFDQDGSDTGSLMLADVDGTDIRELLPHARFESASWSPSGTELAVIVDNGGVAELWILSADGNAPARTIEMPVEPHGWVDWRPPDGRELVFRGRNESDRYAIYAVPPEGGEATRVSSLGTGERWMGSFSLAPDGAQMTFTGWVGPRVSLQVLDVIPGAHPRRMFDKLPLPAADIGVGPVHDGDGVYSPDGTSVVFGRYWDEHDGTINHQLWMASADGDGSDAVPITPVTRSAGGVNPYGQVFSPDATRVVIRVDPSRTAMVLDPRTGSSEPLDWSEDTPAWQRVAP